MIARDKWAYVVRHVRHRESLTSGHWWDGTIIGGLITLISGSVDTVAGETSKGWKVAGLCYPRSWWCGRLMVLLKEQLPDGQDPEARVQYLVDAVNRGEFD